MNPRTHPHARTYTAIHATLIMCSNVSETEINKEEEDKINMNPEIDFISPINEKFKTYNSTDETNEFSSVNGEDLESASDCDPLS